MGIKQIIVCDGCDKELNRRKDRYYINFRTSKFLDAAGDTDYNEIDLVFCRQCAISIKSTLNKILEKQKAEKWNTEAGGERLEMEVKEP